MLRLETSDTESPPSPPSSPPRLVLPPPPFLPDPVTLPRAAPLPLELTPVLITGDGRRTPTTVSPVARDVEPSPAVLYRVPRRARELALAAVLAFGVAWLTRGVLARSEPAAVTASPVLGAAPPAAAPPAPCPLPPAPVAVHGGESPADSQIPHVAVSELPLLGRASHGASAEHPRKRRAESASSASAPNRRALGSALSQVAESAGSCGERPGPVHVVVTFANSGAARSVQVSGDGLLSSTRSCIASAAARARVPAFQGEPVTVSKTL